MSENSNPWTMPEIAAGAVDTARAAQKLASDRLIRVCRLEADNALLTKRIEQLEEAMRYALSKIDRRTSVAKRLEAALFNRTPLQVEQLGTSS